MDESPLPPGLAARLAHVPPGALDFAPVRPKARRDGWDVRSQRTFIVALAAGLGISAACRSVGKSRQTAYALRERPDGASFTAAWDRALHFARLRPLPAGTTAWERAIEGVLVPVRYRGRVAGWRRKYCDRTLGRLLAPALAGREAKRSGPRRRGPKKGRFVSNLSVLAPGG